MEKIEGIKVIAFDADDTLWVNEPYFQEIENKFCEMMEVYHPRHTVSRELLGREIRNLEDYGYGIKSFMLSMIETAIDISDSTIKVEVIERIIQYGKEMLHKPIELLDGVENVLGQVSKQFRVVMATKGDLLDQERKLIKSGLEKYFHHIEILSDKKEINYQKLIRHLDINPGQFLMIGNSLKSDVLPVLNLGGWACHVPFHTTWEHEKIDYSIENQKFRQFTSISDLLEII
ncbi:MAG: HAD family hydrolase [Saprospiraceae bacterium]|nr:HAD family hydrolase [Saprospiraceae bacterium]